MPADGRYLLLPIQESEEVVAVDVEKLPENVDVILSCLSEEQVPLTQWLYVAILYYTKNNLLAFEKILQTVAGESDSMNAYRSDVKGRTALTVALASHLCSIALQSKSLWDEHFGRAMAAAKRAEVCSKTAKPPLVATENAALICNSFLLLAEAAVSHRTSTDVVDRTKMGLLSKAASAFASIIRTHPDDILSRLGLAAAEFQVRNFPRVLLLLCEVLALCPMAPANIRFAIGVCFFNLGCPQRAILAFERCIQLDANNIESRLYLMALDGENRNLDEDLVKCLEVDPNHLVLLLMLAEINFFAGNFQMAGTFTMRAGALAQSPLAESHVKLLEARLKHSAGQWAEALVDYRMACAANPPGDKRATFGAAQCALMCQQYDDGLSFALATLSSVPNLPAVVQFVAICHIALGDRALRYASPTASTVFGGYGRESSGVEDPSARLGEANHHYTEALELLANLPSPENDLMRAAIWQLAYIRGHVGTAGRLLNAYRKLEGVSMELRMNTAIISSTLGNSGDGINELNEIEAEIIGKGDVGDSRDFLMTLKFNRGLLLELSGELSKANSEYKNFIVGDIHYVESQIRRAWVAAKRGDLAWARQCCEAALSQNKTTDPTEAVASTPAETEASILLAVVWHQLGRLDRALYILSRRAKVPGDCPSLEASVKFFLGAFQHMKGTTSTKTRAEEFHLANRSFSSALSLDRSSWPAANGLAVLLAEQNHLTAASEILRHLGDTSGTSENDSLKGASSNNILQSMIQYNLGLLNGLMVLNTAGDSNHDQKQSNSQMLSTTVRHLRLSLSVDPNNQQTFFTLGRILFDSGKFKECQSLMEECCVKWRQDVRFEHNLAVSVEHLIYQNLKNDSLCRDPSQIREWLVQCSEISSIHARHLKLGLIWSQGEALKLKRPIRPVGLEELPSAETLGEMGRRTAVELKSRLEGILPAIEESWSDRQREISFLLEKNAEMRRVHQADKTRKELEKAAELRAQRELADRLQREQEEIASTIPLRREEEDNRRNGKRKRDDFDDFIVEGDVRDGELDDDKEVTKRHREHKKSRDGDDEEKQKRKKERKAQKQKVIE